MSFLFSLLLKVGSRLKRTRGNLIPLILKLAPESPEVIHINACRGMKQP